MSVAEAFNPAGINLTARAVNKVRELVEEEENPSLKLRVYITGGGCSGFSYEFGLEDGAAEDDMVIERNGHRVLIDAESLPFLGGSVIDFKDELIGARFAVENPNATSTCGCGTSFSV